MSDGAISNGAMTNDANVQWRNDQCPDETAATFNGDWLEGSAHAKMGSASFFTKAKVKAQRSERRDETDAKPVADPQAGRVSAGGDRRSQIQRDRKSTV